MRIYLDVCCLNRPFDDQSQERIHLEAEAVIDILQLISERKHEWITSDVIELEARRNNNSEQQQRILTLLKTSTIRIALGQQEIVRARLIESMGFALADALHLACAESGGVDIFLTTDDKFLKRAERLSDQINVNVGNPSMMVEELRR
jgi:predicted nucleic acid-binding protein